MSRRQAVRIGAATDPGRARKLNEDSIGTPAGMHVRADLRLVRGELLAVADGMGGHAAGEVASQQAIATLYSEYYSDASPDLAGSLQHAIERANSQIYTQASSDQSKQGMGATLVAAVIQGSHLIIANVGDSRAYLIREGQIWQISQDHSWVAESLAMGLIDEEQARAHTHRSLVTRALGHRPEVYVDIFLRSLRPGDAILLCSDGLTNEVDDVHIARAVSQRDAKEAAQTLIALANQQGGRDNISAIVAQVSLGLNGARALPLAMVGLAVLAGLCVYALLFSALQAGPGSSMQDKARTLRREPTVPVSMSPPAYGIVASATSASTEDTLRVSTPVVTGPAAAAATSAPTSEVTATPLWSPAALTPGAPVLPGPESSRWVLALQLGWGCESGSECQTNGDALRGLLRMLGDATAYAEPREIADGHRISLIAPLQAGYPLRLPLAQPPLRCLRGEMHGLQVKRRESYVFLAHFEVQSPGSVARHKVRVHRSREELPCWQSPPEGSQVMVCGRPSRPRRHSALDAELVVVWPAAGQPHLWLSPEEPRQWLAGGPQDLKGLASWLNHELGRWMAADQTGGSGREPLLVCGQWQQKHGGCQLDLEPVPIADRGPAVFIWNGDTYVHSSEGGQ